MHILHYLFTAESSVAALSQKTRGSPTFGMIRTLCRHVLGFGFQTFFATVRFEPEFLDASQVSVPAGLPWSRCGVCLGFSVDLHLRGTGHAPFHSHWLACRAIGRQSVRA